MTEIQATSSEGRLKLRSRIDDLTVGRRWWLGVLIMHTATRLVLLPAFWLAWSWPFGGNGGYFGDQSSWWKLVTRIWDGDWYAIIATDGYPKVLPINPEFDLVSQNPWAFYPGFPYVVRGLMMITGGSWDAVAPPTVFVLSFIALCLVYILIKEAAPRAVVARPQLPFMVVTSIAVFPGSIALSVAYSEALALVLIAWTLLCLVRNQYGWVFVPILMLSVTRGVLAPIVAVIIWHTIHRYKDFGTSGRGFVKPRKSEMLALSLAVVVAGAMSFLWPAIAGYVTGDPAALVKTQYAWHGRDHGLTPFGAWYSLFANDTAVTIFLVCVAASVIAWSFSKKARSLGPEIQAWGGAYVGYLIATIGPTTSILRYLSLSILLQATIILGARDRRAFAFLVTVIFVLQFSYVLFAWGYVVGTP